MPRTRLAVAVFFYAFFYAFSYASFALAQPFDVDADASTKAGVPDAAASAAPLPNWPRSPAEPSATTSSSAAPRPDPGPGLKERGGRAGRGNPASGVLLVIVIVAALGWYVVKRIKRF